MSNKEIPSQFNGILNSQPSTINNKCLNFINISIPNFSKKGCRRAENQTRNFQLTAEGFTTKLLTHNNGKGVSNYLNLYNQQ